MKPLDLASVQEYVNDRIEVFHHQHSQSIQALELTGLVRQNPYLYRARHFRTAAAVVDSLLEYYLSASQECFFGRFLADLVVFVAQQTCDGYRSAAEGVDLEFGNEGVHYLISVKPVSTWGNSAQKGQLERDLKAAIARADQHPKTAIIQPVLGICYGYASTSQVGSHLRVVGQDFWYFVSESMELYTMVIEPLRYRLSEIGQQQTRERSFLVNRLMKEFLTEFCEESGAINWPRVVNFVDRIHA